MLPVNKSYMLMSVLESNGDKIVNFIFLFFILFYFFLFNLFFFYFFDRPKNTITYLHLFRAPSIIEYSLLSL